MAPKHLFSRMFAANRGVLLKSLRSVVFVPYRPKKLARIWSLIALTAAICACKSNPSRAQHATATEERSGSGAIEDAKRKPASKGDLMGPTDLEGWVDKVSVWTDAPKTDERYSHALKADRFQATVYAQPSAKAYGFGSVRGGNLLWGRSTGSYNGCRAGWYELVSGGYACASGSFRPAEQDERSTELLPDATAAVPYHYVRVADKTAWRFKELPTAEQLAQARAGNASDATDVQFDGDYFLAVVAEVEHEGEQYLQTLAGKYVRADAVVPTATTTMRGKLVNNPELDLAFVIDDDVVTYTKRGKKWVRAGVAARYARFEVHDRVKAGKLDLLVDKSGVGVPRVATRMTKWVSRPSEVGANDKWVHVDLAEQLLVAYEGDVPRMVTLVSSGKEGHDTPTGLFRIKHKHLTTTMSGDDPIDGFYEVGEVPWTMYYYKSYALHGAYWHDTFGRVRSHGCTNIPPADARWLMEWTSPSIPDGWHSVRPRSRDDGSYVYLTREERE